MQTAAALSQIGRGFRHFSYVTDNIDKTIALFRLMGASGFDKNDFGILVFALGDLGDGDEVEIIQPVGSESIYAGWLERHGPGLQHVAFDVPDFAAVYDELLRLGCPVVQEARGEFGGRRVETAYFDCTAIGGPMIEVNGKFDEPD
jgi:4-hydroxyphenylpyruvate dioxygenase-like putative hemolysin